MLFTGDPDKFLHIKFTSFLTECEYDYLFIYDGDSFSSPLLGAYAGALLPDDIIAPSGSVSTAIDSTWSKWDVVGVFESGKLLFY